MKNNAGVTIGLVMRERFSCTAETLKALYRHTPGPFNLVLVDCQMPSRYRKQVDHVLRDVAGARIISLDRFVLPNAARNIVLAEAKDEYVCLFENDNLVHDDWLTPLLETAASLPSGGIVTPLLLWDDDNGNRVVHYDHVLDTFEVNSPTGHVVRRVSQDCGFMRSTGLTAPIRVNSTEAHVILGSRESLERIVPFDEEIATRECYDLTASIHDAELPVILDPRSRVIYTPSRLEPDDYDFWFFAKDITRSVMMNRRVMEKWRIQGMTSSMNFVKGLHYAIEDEIRGLRDTGSIPGFYFHLLQRDMGCIVSEDGNFQWIEHPSGNRLRCNNSALEIWKQCDGTKSLERIAFDLKKRHPQHAATMIRDVAEIVNEFIRAGMVNAKPAW